MIESSQDYNLSNVANTVRYMYSIECFADIKCKPLQLHAHVHFTGRQ